MRTFETFDYNIDLLLKSFSDAGAIITEGTGKLFVNGQETDIVTALKQGFCDFDSNKATKSRKEYKASVTVDYRKVGQKTTYGASDQQMIAA